MEKDWWVCKGEIFVPVSADRAVLEWLPLRGSVSLWPWPGAACNEESKRCHSVWRGMCKVWWSRGTLVFLPV